MAGFLRGEIGQDGGDAVQDAFDIHVYHRVPVGGLQRGERRVRHESGVQEDGVDFAEGAFGERHQRGAVFGAGDVGHAVHGFAAACFDVRGDGFEFVFTACAEDEFCAFSGEFEGGRLADAGGSAGDDDDFVGDVLHGYLLWVLDSEGRFTYTSSAQVYVNACGLQDFLRSLRPGLTSSTLSTSPLASKRVILTMFPCSS